MATSPSFDFNADFTKSEFDYHVMSRVGKPYSCGICGKALDRRHKDLSFHSVIYSGDTSVIEKEYV